MVIKIQQKWKFERLRSLISHGSKMDLENYLIKQMAEQCKLDKNDFLNLAFCTLGKEEYIEKLKQKGIID